MAATLRVIGSRPDILPGSEFFCEPEDGQAEHVSAQELLEGESLVQEKIRKKKKKHKGSLQSPKQILAFNKSKLLKLDEQKAELKSKILSKCPSFPVASSVKAGTESSADAQASKDCAMPSSPQKKIAVLSRVASLPIKSALRGSFEELGIGPRPKLRVQWDPSVQEPPCSTISHTLIKKCPKKKGSKHCSSVGADLCMKQDREKAQNVKLSSDSRMPMIALGSRHEQLSQDGNKDFNMSESETLGGDLVSREVARHRTGEEDEKSAAMNSQYVHDSTCGSSFFVGSTVPCSFLYGEVL